jgi:succinate dehydrogenase/fumarate reductase flavoprotein subunit
MAVPQHRDYDWISAGSGVAGLAGALAAALRGQRTLLVEKASRIGGQTAYSYGSLYGPVNSLKPGDGFEKDRQGAEEHVRWLSGGFFDERRLSRFCQDSAAALAFFHTQGVELRPIANLPDLYYPTAPGSTAEGHTYEVVPLAHSAARYSPDLLVDSHYLPPGVSWSDAVAWGGFARRYAWPKEGLERAARFYAAGQGLIARLLECCLAVGVEVVVEAPLRRLMTGPDGVTGVELDCDGDPIEVRAGSVFLGTGSYEANPEMVRAYEYLPLRNHALPSQTGDGMIAAGEIGAAISIMPLRLVVNLGFDVIENGQVVEFRTAFNEQAAPHCIIVNDQGQRFADESFFQELSVALRDFDVLRHRFANLPAFLVFDGDFADKTSFCGQEPGAPIPAWVERADSLPELAAMLSIDPDGLQSHMETFNTHARSGKDPAFGRGKMVWASRSGGDSQAANPVLGPVETPPFYGVAVQPTGLGSAGLVADDSGRVRHLRGHAIPHLYAAGNVCTCNEYGAGYQAGLSLTSALVFGLRAVDDALGGAEKAPSLTTSSGRRT